MHPMSSGAHKWSSHEAKPLDAGHEVRWRRTSDEGGCNDPGAKDATKRPEFGTPPRERRSGRTEAKTQPIEKLQVWQAWQHVRKGGKAVGIDGVSIAEIDANPSKYLYPLWNRMASGSYHPPAVREHIIPKGNGKERKLGIPTVLDRVAQQVIRAELEPLVEPGFHPSSYGYRPKRDARDALASCVSNCKTMVYVTELDISGFFDAIKHEKMMAILEERTDKGHVLLYCRRWLQAQIWKRDGTFEDREEGTPQGGVISPLLANIFLDEVFDRWMAATYPGVPFERYADDIVVHAVSEREAKELRDRIRERLGEYGLEVNEEKTRVVYCWRNGRPPRSREEIPQEFDFLGFTFKPRLMKRKSDKRPFWGFWPAISKKNERRIGGELRKLEMSKWQGMTLREVSKALAPRTRGWISYYGRYSRSEMTRVMYMLNTRLVKWVRRKFGLPTFSRARGWLCSQEIQNRTLFHHWSEGFGMWQYLLRRAV